MPHDDDDDDVAPHNVPGWSGFNAAVSSSTPAPGLAGYCPVIEASPGVQQRDPEDGNFPYQHDIHSCHWKEVCGCWTVRPLGDPPPDMRRNRSLMTLPGWGQKVLLLAIIPVPHLFIEAGIVVAGSVSGVVEAQGRQYNRAMRAHKIVMEAMQRLHTNL